VSPRARLDRTETMHHVAGVADEAALTEIHLAREAESSGEPPLARLYGQPVTAIPSDLFIPPDALRIMLEAFEGPLDLLLYLIRRENLNVLDIPMAQLTAQYMAYVEIMRAHQLELAAEYLLMAALLIEIKSRMLLPQDETVEAGEQEDPRAGLVQRLLEYQAFKEASGELRKREEVWLNAFTRPPMEIDKSAIEPELALFEVNLFDLVGALNKILSKAPPEEVRITKETLTVKDRIAAIMNRLEQESTVRFDALFEQDKRRVQIIVTFLALLEILRLGLGRVYQDGQFGAIWIMRHDTTADDSAAVEV